MVAIPAFALTWIAVQIARDARIKEAMSYNASTARLGASNLNATFGSRIVSIKERALKESVFARTPAAEKEAARLSLNRLKADIPELQAAAVYSREGRFLASYPQSKSPGPQAPIRLWYGSAQPGRKLPPVYVRHTLFPRQEPILALVLPLGSGAPSGYLLVSWKDQFVTWMRERNVDSTGLYIANESGQVIASTSDRISGNASLFVPSPDRIKRLRRSGALTAAGPPGIGDVILGYAKSDSTGLILLVVQPRSAVIAGADTLAALFWGVFVALVSFSAFTAWKLSNVYGRQELMALQVEEQNDQLLEAERTRSDVLANISHSLRTPLASLRVTISGMLDPEVECDPDCVREKVRSAYEDVELVDVGVRNLLEMSRIEEMFLSNREPADLTDIVSAALSRLKPRLDEREVDLDFPVYPLIVDCDQSRIETVIVNLLENALKYSPAGSSLYMSGDLRDGYALFSLKDEGPGVEAGLEDLIFDKFFRAPTNTSKGGTGLGLAICKAIIDRHNGKIGVRQSIDGGAEFWFSLPAFQYEPKELA
jgi:signal transduction histidine kinase